MLMSRDKRSCFVFLGPSVASGMLYFMESRFTVDDK